MAMNPSEQRLYHSQSPWTITSCGHIRSAIDNDDTHSADVLEHYGDILFVNGEPDEAQKQWQKALELDPENTRLQQKVKTGKLNENEQ